MACNGHGVGDSCSMVFSASSYVGCYSTEQWTPENIRRIFYSRLISSHSVGPPAWFLLCRQIFSRLPASQPHPKLYSHLSTCYPPTLLLPGTSGRWFSTLSGASKADQGEPRPPTSKPDHRFPVTSTSATREVHYFLIT